MRRRKVSWFAFVILLSASAAVAAPGDLDSDFGNGGVVITSLNPTSPEDFLDVVVQADGKIVGVGYVYKGESIETDLVLVRYHPNGDLDTSADEDPEEALGAKGFVLTDVSGFNDVGEAVALQSDGKIVVAGRSANGTNRDFLIARYNVDGSLDTSSDSDPESHFGTDGIVTLPIGAYYDAANSLAVLPDGKILVVGESEVTEDSDNYVFAAARLHPDGSLDSSTDADPSSAFGGDGIVTMNMSPGYDALYDLLLRPKGRFVAGGYRSNNAGELSGILAGFNRNGSLNTNTDSQPKSHFSRNGHVSLDPVDLGNSGIESLAPYSGGKIVVGLTTSGTGDFVARYSSKGVLDSKNDSDPAAHFSKDGVAALQLGDYLANVLVQPDGRILAVGSSTSDVMLVRLRANGTRDSSFGQKGVVLESLTPGNDRANSGALSHDGNRIVIAGDASPKGDQDLMMARFLLGP